MTCRSNRNPRCVSCPHESPPTPTAPPEIIPPPLIGTGIANLRQVCFYNSGETRNAAPPSLRIERSRRVAARVSRAASPAAAGAASRRQRRHGRTRPRQERHAASGCTDAARRS